MKTALVCIAKNEDNYIDEWLQYHLKLGFSHIFVYQNNWRYFGDASAYGNVVTWLQFDGEAMQMKAYNDFIDNKSDGYDFAAFIDVDEFFCLQSFSSIDNFFGQYVDYYAFAINWRIFGSSGLRCVQNDDYSLLKRFTHCAKSIDKHVKTVLNLQRCGNMFHFVNPHFIDASLKFDTTIAMDKRAYVHGPWQFDVKTCGAQLNHYCCKTYSEFLEKKLRGKADTLKSHPQAEYVDKNFYDNDLNDVEDMTARDFLYSC